MRGAIPAYFQIIYMINVFFQLLDEYKNNGLIMIIIGLVIRFFIGRNKFNRRGVGGLQHFSSFAWGLLVTLSEFIINIGALILIFLGLFYMITNR